MACTLTLRPVSQWDRLASGESLDLPTDLSRVERIRQLLKGEGRAMTDAEIAFDMADHFPNFNTNLVWLLLKHDISKGRVRMIRHGLYRWNEEYESAEATAIRAAVKLLTTHGYTVKAPAP
jgi:hypothetical protein